MPIEVKELIIRANVQGQSSGEGGKPGKEAALKEEILTACLEELTKLLKRQKER